MANVDYIGTNHFRVNGGLDRRDTEEAHAIAGKLHARIAELEKQLSDAHDQDNEMCEGMNAVLDKYNPDWDDVQNTYAANFEKALKALEERAQSAEKQLADLRGDAARYRTLRSTLQTDGSFDIGEAYLKLKVVGAYPEDSDWDATIDALADQSARGSN